METPTDGLIVFKVYRTNDDSLVIEVETTSNPLHSVLTTGGFYPIPSDRFTQATLWGSVEEQKVLLSPNQKNRKLLQVRDGSVYVSSIDWNGLPGELMTFIATCTKAEYDFESKLFKKELERESHKIPSPDLAPINSFKVELLGGMICWGTLTEIVNDLTKIMLIDPTEYLKAREARWFVKVPLKWTAASSHPVLPRVDTRVLSEAVIAANALLQQYAERVRLR